MEEGRGLRGEGVGKSECCGAHGNGDVGGRDEIYAQSS